MGSARKKGKSPPQLRSRQTRSSKGRLLSGTADPAANSALLTSQLRALGLYAADTLGDGNCLFRALSDQLYGTPSRHTELRQRICDWLARHSDRYAPFVEDERGLDTHLSCMRENATYGGHLELSAFAHMEKRDVKVVQPGLVYVIEWRAFASPPPSPRVKYRGYRYDEESEEEDQDKTLTITDPRTEDNKPTKDPHLQSENDTIYVAYHDWEHFSSIRNLRGPHTGLPFINETPPPPPAPTTTTKKKKVTLKLSKSGSPGPPTDPTTVPLPSNRAASPPPAPAPAPAPHLAHSRLLPVPAPRPNPHTHAHAHTQYRTHASPKRALDTTGDESECSSSGSVKRSRRAPSTFPARRRPIDDPDGDGDEEDISTPGDEEEDISTPALSPPSSSSLSSSSASQTQDADMDLGGGLDSLTLTPLSSSASASEPDSEVEVEPEVGGAQTDDNASVLTKRQLRLRERERQCGGERLLTRRQRKALGLPIKSRGAGAGKIVIPGGRFKRATGTTTEGDEEWVRNGTGRVDVRGFRELKI
ncbi:hypothetical protein C0995_011612 [Termitomyces sp. Mi166|nr:hypothetical protein C0995_011612 [Termitomyces sp. Mi166\